MIQTELTLAELNNTFIDSSLSLELSMIPETKGSLIGVPSIKGVY